MYTTLAGILKRIPEKDVIELTDDENTGDVNSLVVNQAITDAVNQINSKLRGRYTVPLSPVPAVIEHIAVVLSIHAFYSRKHQLTISDGLARQYKKALADLDELQKGNQILEGFESSESHPSFILTNKTECDRTFSAGFFSQMP